MGHAETARGGEDHTPRRWGHRVTDPVKHLMPRNLSLPTARGQQVAAVGEARGAGGAARQSLLERGLAALP